MPVARPGRPPAHRRDRPLPRTRLHTILEKVVEEVSYEGPDLTNKVVTIDGPFVREKLGAIIQREDLSKFIL